MRVEILNSKVQLLSHDMRYAAMILRDWFTNPRPVLAREARGKLDLIIERAQEMKGLIDHDMEDRA
jgi:ABC-type lipoprotein export system ATPase subunit